jgi:peptidyl-prolyl cis-trans isomerase B (cyclophilin B)
MVISRSEGMQAMTALMRTAVAAGMLVLGLGLAGCSGAGQTGTGGQTASDQPSASDRLTASAGASGSGVSCTDTPGGVAAKKVDLPPSSGVADTGTVAITMTTGDGPIAMTFDRSNAPCAVNSFVSLAGQHYFDGTVCHRLAVGFVLQCGDPTASGSGGPGYFFFNDPATTEIYTRGTVAMANAGPNTNGSQFFIVLADADLPASYTVLGHVADASMAVVDAIVAKDGDPNSQTPLHPIDVDSITVG